MKSAGPVDSRTFWMSFTDETGFLGVCIIDVTAEEASAPDVLAKVIDLRGGRVPAPVGDAVWLGAAIKKAHLEGCNPGGAVAFADVSSFLDRPELQATPRGKLLQKADLIAIGHIDEDEAGEHRR